MAWSIEHLDIQGRCKDSIGFAVLSPLSSPLSVGGSVTVLVSCVICHRPTLKTGSSQNYDMFQKKKYMVPIRVGRSTKSVPHPTLNPDLKLETFYPKH